MFYLRLIKEFVINIYFRIEYKTLACLSFFITKLKGSNYKTRTKNRGNINFLKERLTKNKKKRLAIFVAFHNRNSIPKSNLNYLDILKKSFFEIIYVHNGNLSRKVINELSEQGCYVICRENIGQDFGAWKDCFTLIKQYKLTIDLNWLLFCNDSNFCLGGKNSDKFVSNFKDKLEKENQFDFISLNCNYESRLHYQSYFLCFSKIVFQNQKFQKFWEKYLPLSHRFHAIENGEKKLSKNILKNFRPNIIYNAYSLSESIILNLNNEEKTLLGNLPKSLFYLEALLNIDEDTDSYLKAKIAIKRIISALESYNQSHVFALLNVIFLDSPFLKKDLVRTGIFSYTQVDDVLKLKNLGLNQSFQEEILNILHKDGTPYSYLEERRKAFRKGIAPYAVVYDYQTDSNLIKESL